MARICIRACVWEENGEESDDRWRAGVEIGSNSGLSFFWNVSCLALLFTFFLVSTHTRING